jgi:hypothetical protein
MPDSQAGKVADKAGESSISSSALSQVHDELSREPAVHTSNTFDQFLKSTSLPTLSIGNDSSNQTVPDSSNKGLVQLAETCRWYDDQGNSGWGDCDFGNGTIRKWPT